MARPCPMPHTSDSSLTSDDVRVELGKTSTSPRDPRQLQSLRALSHQSGPDLIEGPTAAEDSCLKQVECHNMKCENSVSGTREGGGAAGG